MKVHYTYEQRLQIEGDLDLQANEELQLRNAVTDADRHDVLAPLIAAHAMERAGAEGVHMRSIDFAVET